MAEVKEIETGDVLDSDAGAALPSRRRWTRDEFERAGELGFFAPDERLELIGGEVIRKMTPQLSAHAAGIRRAEEALRRAFPAAHDVRAQLPLAIGTHSEPEPDVCVVAGSFRDYDQTHPTTAVLVLEVADTTLAFDRGAKASLYARAGVPDYWIVNIRDRVVEVHREPEAMAGQPFGHHYRSVTRHAEGAAVAPLAAPGAAIPVADLLPRLTA